jgi:phosphoribosylcarboxyaminoimidazole (NCAIR) mutase
MKVHILLGSKSDLPVAEKAQKLLSEFQVLQPTGHLPSSGRSSKKATLTFS